METIFGVVFGAVIAALIPISLAERKSKLKDFWTKNDNRK